MQDFRKSILSQMMTVESQKTWLQDPMNETRMETPMPSWGPQLPTIVTMVPKTPVGKITLTMTIKKQMQCK